MNYKNIIIITVFAVISVMIWAGTPYWFHDPHVYINDTLILVLLAINSYFILRANKNILRRVIIVHSLSVIELLLIYQVDDCGGTTDTRLDYLLGHYADIRLPRISDHSAHYVFALIAIILILIIYLEYKIIKREF